MDGQKPLIGYFGKLGKVLMLVEGLVTFLLMRQSL